MTDPVPTEISTDSVSPVERLLADCLLAVQEDDPDRVDHLLAECPEHAGAVRDRLTDLAQMGLLGKGSRKAVAAGNPERIGPYRILEVLGQGGMGIVYLAEQVRPVRRRVALKVIKLGMDTNAVLARFEQERQALALMNHEGIARVFDCGTTDRGQPFFVMELVAGKPLNRFCDEACLPLGERVELMMQVCEAIQHAHQKGIVHRDLKPGNVLVSEQDGARRVKVIDFGLAKAMGQKLVEATLFTGAGQVMGTPEYMPPEQADPSNRDVDTRSDIYSLGVMLYELLVGELPFPMEELRGRGMSEVQRVLREVDPPRPSSRLTTIREATAAVAERRQVSVAALRRMLKSDLDWVVLKALDKDRNRRYGTASAFAQDLRRFLEHEPLEAGPPSVGYRVGKLLRRYRLQFVAVSLVLAALLLGLTGTSIGFARELEQRQRAEQERATAAAVLQFLKHDLFGALDPDRAQGRKLTLEQAFESGVQRVDDAFPDQPQVEAELRQTFGCLFYSLGEYERARQQLQIALLQGERCFGRQSLHVADTLMLLANIAAKGEDKRRTLSLARRAAAIRSELLSPDDPRMLETLADVAMFEAFANGRGAPSLMDFGSWGKIVQRLLGLSEQDARRWVVAQLAQIEAHATACRHQQAEQAARACVASARNIPGVGYGMSTYATKAVSEWPSAAAVLARVGWQLSVEQLGADHRQTAWSRYNMGRIAWQTGRRDDAVRWMADAIATLRRTLGDDHCETLRYARTYAQRLREVGRVADGREEIAWVLPKTIAVLGDQDRQTARVRSLAGQIELDLGDLGAAERLLARAWQHWRTADPCRDACNTASLLAEVYQRQGRQQQHASWLARADAMRP